MRPEREQLFDEFNTSIRDAEAKFRGGRWSCSAEVPLDDAASLSWCKDNGAWGLYVSASDVLIPLMDASILLRIAAAEKLEDLWAALLIAQEKQEKDIKHATKLFKSFSPKKES